MIIPEGVNFLEFYSAAKKQGVHITSRFIGVVFNLNGKSPSWLVRIQIPGHEKFLGRFPFTLEGELVASKKYLFYMEQIGQPIRYAKKRRHKIKKKTP